MNKKNNRPTNRRLIYIICLIGFAILAAALYHWRDFFQEGLGNHTFEAMENRTPDSVLFAVIGDYGEGGKYAERVANMVQSWNPDFIVTVGDNNYPKGAADTIDEHVGKLYSKYIFNYKGKYGKGASRRRFFPSPGHVDWDSDHLKPYLDYFDLPGNERYYDFTWGPLHIFILDTDEREPDGATFDSRQAMWLKKGLSESDKPWNIVMGQHSPFTSHAVPDIERMRWPFAQWGADAVITGYYHVYERLLVDGIPYFINGTGGTWVSGFGETDPHSRFRYNRGYGAMAVVADPQKISFAFINSWGRVVDTYQITAKSRPTSGG